MSEKSVEEGNKMDIYLIKTQYEKAKRAKLKDGDTDYQKQEEFLFWLFDSGQLGKMIDRVLELDEENANLYQENQVLGYDAERFFEENKKYREALGFYANKHNWMPVKELVLMNGEPELVDDTPLALEDNGERARQALEESE